MARTVKMLFGGDPADRTAEPAITVEKPQQGFGRAPAPVNRSAADQRTPTARVLSATASSASL